MQVPAAVCEFTCLHCQEHTKDVHKRLCVLTVYSLGWEEMGVIVKLDERMLVVVGIADNVGLPLAEKGGVKVMLPKGGPFQ